MRDTGVGEGCNINLRCFHNGNAEGILAFQRDPLANPTVQILNALSLGSIPPRAIAQNLL